MDAEKLKSKREELTARLGALRADRVKNEQRRRDLALDAELGDAKARKEIGELAKGAAALDVEISTVEAALAEAGRRISAAEAAEREEALRQKARTALAMLDEFEARGEALSGKLAGFIAEYKALCGDFRKLEQVGFAPTTYALIASNMRRAVASALLDTDLRQEFLAPKDRTTFAAVIAGWAANVRARAGAMLNRKQAA